MLEKVNIIFYTGNTNVFTKINFNYWTERDITQSHRNETEHLERVSKVTKNVMKEVCGA